MYNHTDTLGKCVYWRYSLCLWFHWNESGQSWSWNIVRVWFFVGLMFQHSPGYSDWREARKAYSRGLECLSNISLECWCENIWKLVLQLMSFRHLVLNYSGFRFDLARLQGRWLGQHADAACWCQRSWPSVSSASYSTLMPLLSVWALVKCRHLSTWSQGFLKGHHIHYVNVYVGL
jgi:hypothetical protein